MQASSKIQAKVSTHFRQWQRKSYSLFSALGKLVRIAVISVVYLTATQVVDAQNEIQLESGQTDYTLDEIEVKAQRVDASISELSRLVTVVTRKDIERSSAKTIQDYLRLEPGLDVRQRGPDGIQNDFSIRGSSFEQVLVLLNGVPFNDPQTGHFNADIPIPLSAVERIEIIEGSASRWLGPNAYAGAINIVTKRPEESGIAGEITVGRYQYLRSELMLNQAGKKSNHLLAIGYSQSDGYSENTDFRASQMFLWADRKIGASHWYGQFGGLMKGFGAQAFYTPLYPEQYEEIGSGFVSLGWKREDKISFKQEFYYKTHLDEFHLFRNESPSWYTQPNYHVSQVFGIINNVWWDSHIGRFSLGVDWKGESVLSTVLGDLINETKALIGHSDILYTNKAARQHLSLYAEHSLKKGGFSMTSGLMAHLVQGHSAGLHLYPGIDLRYRAGDNSNVFFSINRSLRLPSFTELYYSSRTMQGNPDLLPEEAWTVEAGYKRFTRSQTIKVCAYTGFSENSIDWTKTISEEKWSTNNYGELYRTGVEISQTWRPKLRKVWDGLSLSSAYRFAYLDYNSGDFDSRYVLDYLQHKIVAKLHVPYKEKLMIDVSAIWQDRAGFYTDWTETGESFNNDYDPFWLLDAKISYQTRYIQYYMSATNLFNKEYEDIGHIHQPGLWWRLGLSFRLYKNNQ